MVSCARRLRAPARYTPKGRWLASSSTTSRPDVCSREAVALLPNNAALQYQLGQTYLKLGDPRRATPYLRRAVELDPARFREAP